MEFQVLYKAYLGYEEKAMVAYCKAKDLDAAKKKAKKEIDKLNSKHRGFYQIVKIKEDK